RICVALGVTLRLFCKKDKTFIISLLKSARFRRTVVYNFIDY
ncbi:MAG: hypothetical protein ACI94Y_002924, partial [Maribacter sp.]